eukprot:745731-Hanusia_phi.AAC.2
MSVYNVFIPRDLRAARNPPPPSFHYLPLQIPTPRQKHPVHIGYFQSLDPTFPQRHGIESGPPLDLPYPRLLSFTPPLPPVNHYRLTAPP